MNPEDVRILFESCKARYEAAQAEFRHMLKAMVECGLAKRIEDGYGGDYDLTVVAAPDILSRIEYFEWEDDVPTFWGEEGQIEDEVEWW